MAGRAINEVCNRTTSFLNGRVVAGRTEGTDDFVFLFLLLFRPTSFLVSLCCGAHITIFDTTLIFYFFDCFFIYIFILSFSFKEMRWFLMDRKRKRKKVKWKICRQKMF